MKIFIKIIPKRLSTIFNLKTSKRNSSKIIKIRLKNNFNKYPLYYPKPVPLGFLQKLFEDPKTTNRFKDKCMTKWSINKFIFYNFN